MIGVSRIHGTALAGLYLTTLAGCVSASSLKHASVSSLAAPLAGDPEHLATLATNAGTLWPLTIGGLVAIIAAIIAWFIGSRASAIGLLVIGIVICVAPVFLLDVLTHLSIPLAVILGIAGVATLAYYLGALWQKWKINKNLTQRAEYIEDTANFAELTAGSVGRVLRGIDRKDFNPRKKIR
jgi:ABC-type uncharacterized transport system permease subunit